MEELSQREILESFAKTAALNILKTVPKVAAGAATGAWQAAKYLAPGATSGVEEIASGTVGKPVQAFIKGAKSVFPYTPLDRTLKQIMLDRGYVMTDGSRVDGKDYYYAKGKLITDVQVDENGKEVPIYQDSPERQWKFDKRNPKNARPVGKEEKGFSRSNTGTQTQPTNQPTNQPPTTAPPTQPQTTPAAPAVTQPKPKPQKPKPKPNPKPKGKPTTKPTTKPNPAPAPTATPQAKPVVHRPKRRKPLKPTPRQNP